MAYALNNDQNYVELEYYDNVFNSKYDSKFKIEWWYKMSLFSKLFKCQVKNELPVVNSKENEIEKVIPAVELSGAEKIKEVGNFIVNSPIVVQNRNMHIDLLEDNDIVNVLNIIIINLGNCSREFFYCFKQKAKSVKTDLAFLMKSICLAYCLICILLCVIVMNYVIPSFNFRWRRNDNLFYKEIFLTIAEVLFNV